MPLMIRPAVLLTVISSEREPRARALLIVTRPAPGLTTIPVSPFMVRVKGPVIDTGIGSLTVRLAIVTLASRIVFSFVGAMPVTEKMTLASAARGPVLSPNNVGDQLLPDQSCWRCRSKCCPG